MSGRHPPYLRRSLAALWQAIEASEYDQSQGIPKDHAEGVLVAYDEAEREDGEEADQLPTKEVNRRLEYLRDHGEIYYVDDWIRITEPDKVAATYIEDDTEAK
jgi:hypothetical protein